MGLFWMGAIFGGVMGELVLRFALALVSDKADRRARREIPRLPDAGDDETGADAG